MIDHYIGVDVGTGSVRAGLVSQVSRQYILFLVLTVHTATVANLYVPHC